MNEVMVFESAEFGAVRTVDVNGIVYFVGKDVAEILGYSNTRDALAKRVDDEDKLDGVAIRDPIGREQNPVLINESGLYSLILSSKLPGAKQFKRWVTSEVLPTIRKTGGYVANESAFVDTYLPFADDQTKALFSATLSALHQANSKIEADAPKVETYDRLVDRDGLTNLRDTAKLLGIGQKKFVAALIVGGYLYRDARGKLRPYAKKNSGLFEVKEYINDATGAQGVQTLVTFKGRDHFARTMAV